MVVNRGENKMQIQQAIAHVINGKSLSRQDMQSVMQQIMTGECSDAQIGGFLIGLRMKGETVEEITAAAEVMSSLASHVKINADNIIDIVGTGGDGISTFNVSTAASFVAAGAGANVAKHGNRSVSSLSSKQVLVLCLRLCIIVQCAMRLRRVKRWRYAPYLMCLVR